MFSIARIEFTNSGSDCDKLYNMTCFRPGVIFSQIVWTHSISSMRKYCGSDDKKSQRSMCSKASTVPPRGHSSVSVRELSLRSTTTQVVTRLSRFRFAVQYSGACSVLLHSGGSATNTNSTCDGYTPCWNLNKSTLIAILSHKFCRELRRSPGGPVQAISSMLRKADAL